MKFKIKVGYLLESAHSIGSPEPWWETYCKDVEYPKEWAKELIERFNNSLRQGEFPRKLLDVVVLDEDLNTEHAWEKTNVITIIKKKQIYDTYICKRCGVSSKRFNLDENHIIDNKYGARVYWNCNTALSWLEKKRQKKGI